MTRSSNSPPVVHPSNPDLTDPLNISFQLDSSFFFPSTGEAEDLLGWKGRKLSEFGRVFLQSFVKAGQLAVAQRGMESAVNMNVVDGKRLLVAAHSDLVGVWNGEVHGGPRKGD